MPSNREVIMARGPIRPVNPAQLIANSGLRIPPRVGCTAATDRIDMDHLWLVDPELATQVTAVGLEADAQVHKALADATGQAAKILKSRKL
jgi:hypothetical protein